jgi:hypothetical protein
MFKIIIEFLKKHYTIIIGLLLIGFVGYNQLQTLINPPDLQQFKGGIQNHLVWNIKGECYFVRPHTTSTTYLIRVEDCDKGSK